MPYPANKRVMWLANVRSLPYRERITTAAKAGFGWISTSPMDYHQIPASGLSDDYIRSIAADNDVRLSYLDPLTSWVPDGLPVDEDPAIVPYLNRSQDQFLRIAEALRVNKIHLIGSFPAGRYTIDELTHHYAAMCDRAAENGLKCLIEAMPLWGLRTVDEVWAIVRGGAKEQRDHLRHLALCPCRAERRPAARNSHRRVRYSPNSRRTSRLSSRANHGQ